MKRGIVCAMMVGVLFGTGYAEETLTLKTEAFLEIVSTDDQGKPQVKRVPADKVLPGTEVVYVITYKNQGTKPAADVLVNNPVPKELTYVASLHDADQANLTVSVDSGKTYDQLERLKVKGADGKPRPAKSSDVTDLRWSLKSAVQPSSTGTVSFKAILK